MTRETVRIRNKGEITLPADIRQQMGLEIGALLTAEITGEGLLLRPAEVVARDALAQISKELRTQGVALEDLMAAGRKVRAKVATQKYSSVKSATKSGRKRP